MRREELERIAAVCRRVPAQPPRTFREALQMVWFVQVGRVLSENAVALNLGRLDQYLYPFYLADVDKQASCTPAEAQELLDCLWIKLSEWVWAVSSNTARFFAGYSAFQNLTVGGRRPDGSDGTNAALLHVPAGRGGGADPPAQPERAHPLGLSGGLPPGHLPPGAHGHGLPGHPQRPGRDGHAAGRRALARGRPGLEQLRLRGATLPQGGRVDRGGQHQPGLSGGVRAEQRLLAAWMGGAWGCPPGSPDPSPTSRRFKGAFLAQLAYLVKQASIATVVAQQVHSEMAPRPFLSLLVEGCLEQGRDLSQGGAKYNVGAVLTGIGLADAANSLEAVRTLVFEQRLVTLPALCEALDADWQGHEDLRALALKCSKYGNDEDRVDRLAVEISDCFQREIRSRCDWFGNPFNSAFMGISNYMPAGSVVGATPDGRRAGSPLTEGCSAHAGTDATSPTAVMKSAARINHESHSGGTLLNLKFSPGALKTDRDLANLAAMIRAYFELGAFHVQFNVVSRETLLAAQANPEEHQDLLVRVAGYSARFVTLSKDVQDAILERTSYEHL